VAFGICLFFAFGSTDSGESGSGSSSSSESSTEYLKCSVKYTGTQFVITNNDSFDWSNVKLEINSSGLKSGYILQTSVIRAGQTYKVGAMQFAKKDGEKFNPFTHKALKFTVWCDTPRGKNGFYMGSWE